VLVWASEENLRDYCLEKADRCRQEALPQTVIAALTAKLKLLDEPPHTL
jgi:hypothetical protein